MPQGHRELERREHGDEEERARPAAAPPPAHEFLALQAAAGNRAVARAMLQRDATVAAPGAPVMLPGLNTPLDPSIMAASTSARRRSRGSSAAGSSSTAARCRASLSARRCPS